MGACENTAGDRNGNAADVVAAIAERCAVSGPRDREQCLASALELIARHLGCDAAEGRVREPLADPWRVAASWHVDDRGPISVAWWEDSSTWVSPTLARIDDRSADGAAPELRSEMWAAQVHAAAAVRTVSGDSVLHLSWGTPPGDNHPLATVAAQQTCRGVLDVLSVFERLCRSEEALMMARCTDALTAVSTRPRFELVVEQELDGLAKGAAPALALVLADVTDLRSVNDEYGHRIGDHVLVEFARRLRELVPSVGAVARLGEDEFAVVLRVPDFEAANELASRVESLGRAPIVLPGNVVEIELSVAGVFLSDAVALADVMRATDRALRQVQRAGGGRAELTTVSPD
jgi:diguanylate cyclase (GGDEF)-like protein